MAEYFFTLNIDPRPKARPKVYRWATVNPSQKDEELAARHFDACEGKPDHPLNGQICVWFKFFVNPPKSTPQWKKPLMDQGLIRPNKSPDLDNYVKLILDALNGRLWEDDRYIVEMHSVKFYTTTTPRIEIKVFEYPEYTRNDAANLDLENEHLSLNGFFNENQ